jgi:hypothetical protein
MLNSRCALGKKVTLAIDAASTPDAAMIPHLSDSSAASGRIRRNNSVKYYGKFHPYLVRY